MYLKPALLGKLLLVAGLASCISIVVNFPAAEVREAARQIEKDIRSGQPDSTPDKEKMPPRSEWRRSLPPVALGTYVAEAADVNLNVDSPGIRAAKASRKARYPQLKPYLDDGTLGEDKDGLLVFRAVEGLDARTRVALKQLVESENKDRNTLFVEFARANNLSDIDAVRKQFARAIRDEMAVGQWYQDDSGTWVRKR